MIDIKEQFKEKYAEDIIQLKNLVENYNNLQEQNIARLVMEKEELKDENERLKEENKKLFWQRMYG